MAFPRCCHPCPQARTQAFCLGKLVIYFTHECMYANDTFSMCPTCSFPHWVHQTLLYISTSVSHFICLEAVMSCHFILQYFSCFPKAVWHPNMPLFTFLVFFSFKALRFLFKMVKWPSRTPNESQSGYNDTRDFPFLYFCICFGSWHPLPCSLTPEAWLFSKVSLCNIFSIKEVMCLLDGGGETVTKTKSRG